MNSPELLDREEDAIAKEFNAWSGGHNSRLKTCFGAGWIRRDFDSAPAAYADWTGEGLGPNPKRGYRRLPRYYREEYRAFAEGWNRARQSADSLSEVERNTLIDRRRNRKNIRLLTHWSMLLLAGAALSAVMFLLVFPEVVQSYVPVGGMTNDIGELVWRSLPVVGVFLALIASIFLMAFSFAKIVQTIRWWNYGDGR